jgi:hypothetical protein
MKKAYFVLVAVVSILAFTGCMRNVRVLDEAAQSGEGTTQIYHIDVNTAKVIAKNILYEENFEAVEDRGADLKAVSEKSYFLVVFTQKENGLAVTAISKRRFATQLLTTLTETSFHEQFAERVKRAKAGR